MKKLFLFIILLNSILFSCKKKSGIDDPPIPPPVSKTYLFSINSYISNKLVNSNPGADTAILSMTLNKILSFQLKAVPTPTPGVFHDINSPTQLLIPITPKILVKTGDNIKWTFCYASTITPPWTGLDKAKYILAEAYVNEATSITSTVGVKTSIYNNTKADTINYNFVGNVGVHELWQAKKDYFFIIP